MSIASIHLGAQQAQPLHPYCSGNIAGGRQECQICSLCSSPLALALVGNFVFQAGSQAGKAPTTAQEASTGIPHGWERAVPVALSGSAHPCPWLLLHLCEHHTAFLGTRSPSVSHRWCLEPAVSLWWQSSALGCCWALAEQLGRGACSTVCIWIFCRHPQDYQAQARVAQVAHRQDP